MLEWVTGSSKEVCQPPTESEQCIRHVVTSLRY
jgi:hypothetical protein